MDSLTRLRPEALRPGLLCALLALAACTGEAVAPVCAKDAECPQGKVCSGGQCRPGALDAGSPDASCSPTCAGRECGSDGCGGTCGDGTPSAEGCPTGEVCVQGACRAASDCTGRECGPDGSGGFCGIGPAANEGCPDGTACVAETWRCACAPACDGKACGADGCGGACGDGNAATEGCPALQRCVQGACRPLGDCAGKQCGPDGAGGFCGNGEAASEGCPAGAGCEHTTWSCACLPSCAGKACGPDGCGAFCGSGEAATQGCPPGQGCVAGACQPVASCAGKSCGPDGAGGFCGNQDPATEGCAAGWTCDPTTWACRCVPQCAGKQCGPDGCGGSCGAGPNEGCAATQACAAGTCQCVPQCSGRQCGSDGCGGSCGGCAVGQTCDAQAQCATVKCPRYGPLAGYAEHDGPRAIASSGFHLQDTGTWAGYAAIVDGLGLAKAPLATLPLNRTGTQMPAKGWAGFGNGFYWESGDRSVAYWIPQGLAGGTAGARKLVIVSWHYDEAEKASDPNPAVDFGGDKGVRISIAEVTSTANVTYRHALLVEPDAAAGFKPIAIHAGGLAWTGSSLYVADTSRGLRVFDLDRILTVSTSSCSDRCGKVAGPDRYCAYGYAYVVPQVGGYYFPSTLDATCRPLFSHVSLDRSSTPDSMISGEYSNDTATGIYGRLLRWPVDEASDRLATTGGVATASGAWYAGNRNVQGATAYGDTFFLNATRYSGVLYKGPVGSASTNYRADAGQWAWMPEGMYISAAGNLWVVTEGHASLDRCVFYSTLP